MTITTVIIMRKLEILREVSKGSPETQSEQGLLGEKKKMAPKDLLNAGLPQAFNLLKKKKNAVSESQ